MNHETMEILIAISAIETIIILVALSFILLLRNRKRKKADQRAVDHMAINVKGNVNERRATLLKIFVECSDMDEEQSSKAVESFIEREQAFYKTLMSVYVNRDAKEFVKLSSGLEEMITPYAEIARSTSTLASTGDETVEALQKENEVLEKELDDSKEIMDELLNEFTASFDKNGEGILPEAIKTKKQEDVQSESDSADQKPSSEMAAIEDIDIDIDFNGDEELLAKEASPEEASANNTETNEEVNLSSTGNEEKPSEEIPVVDEIAIPNASEDKIAEQAPTEEAIDLDLDLVEIEPEISQENKNEILEEVDNNDVSEDEVADELIVEDSTEQKIDSDEVESTDDSNEAVSKETKKEVKEESVDDILGELDIA